MTRSATVGSLLESMGKCAIKELEVDKWEDRETLQKFLKAQEKNLKKLVIKSAFDLPNDLKDLRLEHFEYVDRRLQNISLQLLKHQVDLKFLSLLHG